MSDTTPYDFSLITSPDGSFTGVSGRDIHEYLRVENAYSSWANKKIARHKLKKGVDYFSFADKTRKGKGRRPVVHLFSAPAVTRLVESSQTGPMAPAPREEVKNLETLLPITSVGFEDGQDLAVDGRDLHTALNIRRQYTDWVKDQIRRCRLREGEHFCATPHLKVGGVSVYLFSLDAAKHIVIENSSARKPLALAMGRSAFGRQADAWVK